MPGRTAVEVRSGKVGRRVPARRARRGPRTHQARRRPCCETTGRRSARRRRPSVRRTSGCSGRWRGGRRRQSRMSTCLLVDFPAGERRLFPLPRLAREIEVLVGRPVDVVAVEVMARTVRERALAEAVPL